MAISETIPSNPRKWSRLGQLARGAAIAQANRARRRRPWSATEMKVAQETYPNYTLMLQKLPHRTLSQLKSFTCQYGIATKRIVWTTPEVSTLRIACREHWTMERLLAALPRLNRQQIKSKMRWMGWCLNPPFKVMGVPILDAVRKEAHRQNRSLGELDEICGGKLYWQRSCKRISWWRVARVVDELGGRVSIEFNHAQE